MCTRRRRRPPRGAHPSPAIDARPRLALSVVCGAAGRRAWQCLAMAGAHPPSRWEPAVDGIRICMTWDGRAGDGARPVRTGRGGHPCGRSPGDDPGARVGGLCDLGPCTCTCRTRWTGSSRPRPLSVALPSGAPSSCSTSTQLRLANSMLRVGVRGRAGWSPASSTAPRKTMDGLRNHSHTTHHRADTPSATTVAWLGDSSVGRHEAEGVHTSPAPYLSPLAPPHPPPHASAGDREAARPATLPLEHSL